MTENISTENKPHYIVGIGASAGGLEALERFFDHMPSSSGLAFVIVQHLSPDFKSLMDELLARHTQMTIRRVENEMPVEANTIYLIPPRKNMLLAEGRLLLTERQPAGSINLPIDVFFRSLAQDAGERAIAVVLSGTGSDGSRSLATLHQMGGLILVQDEESAGFDGMPRSAIGTGLADFVGSPEILAAKVLSYVENSGRLSAEERQANRFIFEENEISLIFGLLRKHFQVDFSQYKPNTIKRRLERRMSMARIDNIRDYLLRLQDDPQEINTLYRDLLVEVTQFFRDPNIFVALSKTVIPELVDRTPPDHEIRIWVSGCATGEEAYSIAILFDEYLKAHPKPVEVRIFATDVHKQTLDVAGAGIYREESMASLSPERQKSYFIRERGSYRVSKKLRKMVTFAQHNLIQDPPFTRLDLVSCRNVLIYLRDAAQQMVLSNFHFALKTGGYLVVGTSEHLGKLSKEFDALNHFHIYRKRRNVRLPSVNLATPSRPLKLTEHRAMAAQKQPRLNDEWVPDLLAEYVPTGLLLNQNYDVLYILGEASRYLRLQSGPGTLNALKMITGDLQTALRAGLLRAGKSGKTVVYTGIQAETDGGEAMLKVTVNPLANEEQPTHFFVALEPLAEIEPVTSTPETFDGREASEAHIVALERELEYTKEYLKTTIEELETTSEEVQSTNEELVASNEELQSTNEELQSVNEELYTINAEHQRKIKELIQLTDDLQNLQNSTQIGVIFLDTDLHIRTFTPAIASTFNLLPQDVGRPLAHLLYQLDFSEEQLKQDAEKTLSTSEIIEREILLRDGSRFLLRILPYQTTTQEVEGVVLTFTNISSLKKAEGELREKSALLEAIINAMPHALIATDQHQRIEMVNPTVTSFLGYSFADLEGQPFQMLYSSDGQPEERLIRFDEQVDKAPKLYQINYRHKNGATYCSETVAAPIRGEDGKTLGFLALIRDMGMIGDNKAA